MFARIYFCGSAIFCVLREQIFAIRKDWFFFLGIIFLHFSESTQYPALIIFSFLLSTCIFSNNKPVFCCFWQVVIEQTRFVSTVYLCSELKLETIYSGVNFCRKNVCGNFYLRGTYSCGSLKKPQKLEPAKSSCHTVLIKKY